MNNYNIILIFIFISILLYIYCCFYKEKICIIGNGPLQDKEIDYINKNYKIIVVMNSAAKGDKNNILNPTHLFSRQWGDIIHDKLESIHFLDFDKKTKKYHSYDKYSNSIQNIILIVPDGNLSLPKEDIDDIKNNYNNVSVYEIDKNLNHKNNEGPNNFKICNKKYRINHSLSTGIIVIKYMLDKYPYHDIHIYGMNFAQRGHHDGIVEKEMVKECRRCKLHKTWKDTYEPFTVK